MDFVPVFLPVAKQPEDGWWFIFCGDKLLVKDSVADGPMTARPCRKGHFSHEQTIFLP